MVKRLAKGSRAKQAMTQEILKSLCTDNKGRSPTVPRGWKQSQRKADWYCRFCASNNCGWRSTCRACSKNIGTQPRKQKSLETERLTEQLRKED
eukprot:367365-Amphidinium_carterae.1